MAGHWKDQRALDQQRRSQWYAKQAQAGEAGGAPPREGESDLRSQSRTILTDSPADLSHDSSGEVRASLVEAGIPGFLADRLLELTEATKQAWGTCSRCKCRVLVEVPDSSAAASTVRLLLDRTLGKVRDQPETGAEFVLERKIIRPE